MITKNYIIYLFLFFSGIIFSQSIDLEYIFQSPPPINPRPSVKAISFQFNKLYYYADPDFNHTTELYEYNFISGSHTQVSDSTTTYSEFHLLENGDLVTITDGDVFLSKNFAQTNEFTKDIQYTESNEYEYGLNVSGNILIFRRAGDYFMKLLNSPAVPELRLTYDESDTISYQLIGVSKNDTVSAPMRLIFSRYDNSGKKELLVPDYTKEFVKVEKLIRGVSGVKYISYDVKRNKEQFVKDSTELILPGNIRYSVNNTDHNSDNGLILFDAETIDRRTRKLFLYDVSKKSFSEIYNEYYQDGWLERHGTNAVFLNDNDITFETEINGFNSIYKLALGSSSPVPVISGNFTVLETITDRRNNKIYYIANPDDPTAWNVFETDFNGSYVKQLTSSAAGYEDMRISPAGDMLFFSKSFTNIPHELYFLNISAGEEKQITNTISPVYSNINWIIPELITFQNYEDGQTIYAHLYKPRKFDPKKKYPLICFAHGSGYLQNVTKGFAYYQDNFMVHTYWAEKGFLVLDVDYRGSMGHGADFRNKTWHNLGNWEVSDFISGIKYLESQGMIDRNKVGIYGGSYGGFITLMSVFWQPDYFKAGVALRAVSDWSNYYYVNPWFTYGRLGDDPETEVYKLSSPVTFAQDLQVPLLIMHGMLDDNVFFQQMVRLTQKLIENKKDFEVMFYPREYHSFHIQTSWLDEYKRTDRFFEKHLR